MDPCGCWTSMAGRDQLAADREPMIVPPAALKSPYYGNERFEHYGGSPARR